MNAAESAATMRAPRATRVNFAISVLAIMTLVAALYLARAFFVPLLIGILASYALSPVIDWFARYRLPRAVAAALVLVTLVGGMSWLAFSLSDDASAMIEKLPDAARRLRQTLSASRASGPTALQKLQDAANEIQAAAADAGAKRGLRAIPPKPAEPSTWLRDYVLAQFTQLVSVAAQAPIVLLLTFFLLASGTHFRRKLIGFVGPSLSQKKDAILILEEVDAQVQRYLLSILVSNALVAICSWLAFKSLGLEQAGVLGVVAGVLHFIPYLGPVLTALIVGIAAFLQFGALPNALAVAGASLLVAGAIGFLFMTWLQSRFARVNAAVLFIAMLFFGWLWGVWGLLLGAPLLAIAKAVCDRIESFRPIGELLGR